MISTAQFLEVCHEINLDIAYFAATEGEQFASDLLERIETFECLSNAMFYALAGFSSTRFPNIIYCELCYIHFKDVENDVNLLLAHKICSPDCQYVKNVLINDEIRRDIDILEFINYSRVVA